MALPETLRGNETLARFPDVGALAQGYLDTKALATSRSAIPAADAAPEVWSQFYEQLGRPKEATAYDFKVPEGDAAPMADAFRPIAFEMGLTGKQATRIAEFWNAQNSAAATADKATLDAFKAAKGADYPRLEQAAIGAFKAMKLDGAFPDALAKLTSSGALVQGFAQIAELIGEHGHKGPDDPQDNLTGVPDSQAEAKLDALRKDPEWIKKMQAKDPAVRAQHGRLLEQAKRNAARQLGG
jgi:hypothetical protein